MALKHLRWLSILIFVLNLISAGCSPFGAGTQQSTRFYVLSSLQGEADSIQPMAKLSNIGIGVGPIRMPLYLDRLDIVTRGSQNKVEIAGFAQWAGPLPENFSRVLAENLSVLLATDKIAVFPYPKSYFIDYNVAIYVTRFDGSPGDKAHLRARWSILDRKRRESLYEKHSVVTHPTENETTEALIAAKSKTVSDLSREIANAMIEVYRKYPPQKKKK
jgi:uncharacterized lipoprotein YmbA